MAGSWRNMTWGDLASLEYGRGLRGYEGASGCYRVFGTNGPIGWHEEPLCRHPTVVIGRKGAYRGVHYSAEPCFVIDTAFYLEPRVELDIRWAYYELLTHDINSMDSGSAIPSTSRNAFYRLPVHVPPIDEQRAIAAVLGALDDKIELNRRMCRTLEGIARAIFQAWFVDFEPVKAKAGGAKRFRGMPQAVFDTLPTQFVDSPLGPIPKGWQVGTLGEYIEAAKGLSYKGSGLCDGGIPLHNLNSVYEGGGYKYEGIKYYSGEYRDRHIIRPGDIIVTNTEQGHDLLLIGYPAIVPRRFGDWGLFSHHLFRVRPKPESPVTRHYVYFILMTPRVRDQVTGHTNGTTVNMLSVSGLEMPAFVVPPPEVLRVFESLAASAFARMEQTHDQSATLAALRDALLPKLVSGELRIRDVERIIGRCA